MTYPYVEYEEYSKTRKRASMTPATFKVATRLNLELSLEVMRDGTLAHYANIPKEEEFLTLGKQDFEEVISLLENNTNQN